ncbi:MAG: M18 family aminopeptidase [bacterium]|nr:M18 family aminopeptidase [bacterium]
MNTYIESLLKFMDSSVCNFLAVDTIKKVLVANGFVEKRLEDAFTCQAGEKFFVTKNDSAIFAVTVGAKPVSETGFKIISAHSDSPCFRIKPNPEMVSGDGLVRLNTEVYGGPILYTWFDRPLSLAGRVILKGKSALHPVTRLLKIDNPILVIPHLAIHFNRSVNEGNPLSKQKDMLPILTRISSSLEANNLLINYVAKSLDVSVADILDFDLFVYDTEKACVVGLNDEFVLSGRLDDLSMAHAAITAITEATDSEATCVSAIFDNEETGSGTKQGAHSPVLTNILRRVATCQGVDFDGFCRAVSKSFLISADNAHAFHPNYGEKYDPTNHPAIGGGPVIKINANCKYMTDAHSAAIFKSLCIEAGSPYQYFVNHSDVAGGSTLGNIFTGQLDIEGVDVGSPLLAMHSVRETASTDDHVNMIKVFKHFFS